MSGPRNQRRGKRRGRNGGAPGRSGDRPERVNGTAPGRGRRVDELCELAPFSVFCALYLGITEEDGYARPDPRAVARRFDLSDAELQGYLEEHGLTAEDLDEADFDLESARLDIQVAPEGISRVELARSIFAEARGTSG